MLWCVSGSLIKGKVRIRSIVKNVAYRGSWLDEGTLFPPNITKSSESTSVGTSDSTENVSLSSGGGLLPLMN